MNRFAGEMAEHRAELVALDTAIGDGDHGTNMDRGMTQGAGEARRRRAGRPRRRAQDRGDGARSRAWAGRPGRCTARCSCRWAARWPVRTRSTCRAYAAAWRKGLEGVQARGKAQPGDKTMVDALIPAVEALEAASDLDGGLRAAAQAAEEGMKATTPLVARKGRASYLGERSEGPPRPGRDLHLLPLQERRRGAGGLKGEHAWRSTQLHWTRGRPARGRWSSTTRAASSRCRRRSTSRSIPSRAGSSTTRRRSGRAARR